MFSITAAPTTIAEVDSPKPEMTFLDTVSDCASTSWVTTVSMLNHPVKFKIDTVAAVSSITEETYFELKQPKLYQAKKKLSGPAQQNLEVLGVFQLNLECQQRIDV